MNTEDKLHPSHKTRVSDASSFDEVCIYCGATDELGSWGNLAKPCPDKTIKKKDLVD
jgi:hypothetical protein